MKVGDLFTACYSTILATAVFADARVKEERRKEWDRVIAEAKAGNSIDETAIPKGTSGQQKAVKLNLRLEYYRASDNLGSWNSTSWEAPTHRYESAKASLERLDNELRGLADTPENLVMAEETPTSSSGQSEEWYDEDDIQALPSVYFAPREPLTSEHTDMFAQMVRNLVDQFLSRMDVFSIAGAGTTSASTDIDIQKMEMAQRIKKLKTTFIEMPAYSKDGISSEQRTALHKSIVTACTSTTPDRSNIELLVAKICYNLLVSTTPPSIGTYNILIREFTRLQQYDLAQDVVDSFYQSKLKPNDRTIKLILDHFIAGHDPIGFQKTIDRMSVAKDNMNIRTRTVYQLSSPDVLQWAMTNRTRRLNDFWLAQKVDRSPAIFEALIRGSFERKGVRPTIRCIKASLREGQMVPSRAFYNAVEACLSRFDYKAARNLLRVILSTWEHAHTLLEDLGPDFRYAFHKLLYLCNIDSAPDSNPILPPFISLHTLRDFIRWLRIKSLEDSINRYEVFVSSLRTTLKRIQPQPHELRKPDAQPTPAISYGKVGNQAIWEGLDRLEKFGSLELSRKAKTISHNAKFRSSRLQFLQREIDDMEISTASISREFQDYRARQSRSSQIRAIEAELAIRVRPLAIAGFEVVPLFLDRLSTKSWDKFITTVRNVHSAGLSFNDPLKYLLRLISREERMTSLWKVETHNPKPSIRKIRPAIPSPFRPQHQLPSPFADLC